MTWDSVKVIQDEGEHVHKYVFEKSDAVAEAVLYRYPTYLERTVVCCSTQSGCPVGCRFCGAGDHFVRSLTADEIVSQPVRCLSDTGVDPSGIDRLQIMFMSMGEPLLNLGPLEEAILQLHALYPKAKLLISTSGPRADYQRVRDLSAAIQEVGLQFSVHETTDEKRNALIPFKAKLSLEEISAEGWLWNKRTGRKPFFNYCAHDGNVSQEDANRLRALFPPRIWEATVSVVCERGEWMAARNARQRELAMTFAARLSCANYSVRVFDPAGQDTIGGGCGQLWFVQDWMRSHPDKARKSCGSSLPAVHAPKEG